MLVFFKFSSTFCAVSVALKSCALSTVLVLFKFSSTFCAVYKYCERLKHCGVCTANNDFLLGVLITLPYSSAILIVSLTCTQGAHAPVSTAVFNVSSINFSLTNGLAASCIATISHFATLTPFSTLKTLVSPPFTTLYGFLKFCISCLT